MADINEVGLPIVGLATVAMDTGGWPGAWRAVPLPPQTGIPLLAVDGMMLLCAGGTPIVIRS